MIPFRSRTIHSREALPELQHSSLLQMRRKTWLNGSECTVPAALFPFRFLLESRSGRRFPAPSALFAKWNSSPRSGRRLSPPAAIRFLSYPVHLLYVREQPFWSLRSLGWELPLFFSAHQEPNLDFPDFVGRERQTTPA